MNLTFMYWDQRGDIYILRQYKRHLLDDVQGTHTKVCSPLLLLKIRASVVTSADVKVAWMLQ